ncbi:PBP1A family penicillin-binding protein [Mesorhizobium sp. NBSH29]|uniref:penicillin-binding protein 1A n=1 Tax=Mesorhizobium sp. NBSH29 TaxID=2654249 RepID=UPI0018967A92|nr:penicillin-binding protein 1A [Mesorhizobium sp. NBSH29]QPC87853.1 PBP1A family penicillin-binding protein [Mesorhizobium sp. NBSH29]
MLRIIGYFFGVGVMLALLAAGGVAIYIASLTKDLPDYEVLAKYEPPVTTRIHASDGALMGEYARERRLYLPIQAVPDRLKAAFLSAEDKNFYNHPGVDITGLFRAVVTNLQNVGSGRRPVGASTITQQVAKNFLLSASQTYDRKIREMILAFRIEQAYSKDRILELYMNEIFFGLGAYGVAGAALTYFDKSVNELSLSQAAYLAALPKGPSNYQPFRYADRAIVRRNWVIDQMVDNGYASREEGEKAKAEDLGVSVRRGGTYLFAGEYFTEEVRRELIARYGENALYEGGLSVRTTLDPEMQLYARRALQNGLLKFDRLRGYRGPVQSIELGGDWGVALGKVKRLDDVPEWKLAVVLDSSVSGLTVGLQPDLEQSGALNAERKEGVVSLEDMSWAMRHMVDGQRVKAKTPADVLKPGDVVFVENKEGNAFALRQTPEVAGGMVAMDPHTGRVLAMVGGFSYSQSEFNRATQAYRQPGSAFKPFVYAAALDNGYTPASVVMDGPISIKQAGGEVWEPKNYDGKPGGPSTLRTGIERSRNLMTVRLANDMGMQLVAEYAERFGVYDKMLPVLAMALGSGETTVMRMVSAYSVMANGGKQIHPSLIDRIQDRYGKTVFRHDERSCNGCNAQSWNNQDEPELVDNAEQVLDPMTAYQITSMMEGVVTRGTAITVSELGRPIAGKTGTTNDEKDTWFMGYSPNLVVGLYMGYDQPQTLGKGATGGGLAAPVFKEFMANALKDEPIVDFQVPPGMKIIAINRKTGMRAAKGEANVIMEAFKPGTGPADSYWVIGGGEVASSGQSGSRATISPQANKAIETGGGGLY